MISTFDLVRASVQINLVSLIAVLATGIHRSFEFFFGFAFVGWIQEI